MLGLAYGKNNSGAFGRVAQGEPRRRYWGSAGSYIKRNQLKGFVQEIGHAYDHLMEGAMPADKNEESVDPNIGIACATDSVLAKIREVEDKDQDDEDEDEDWDEGEGQSDSEEEYWLRHYQ